MEVKPSWVGLSALVKETLESSFAASTTWGHNKKMPIYELGSSSSPDVKSGASWSSTSQSSELWEKKHFLFKPPKLWYFYYGSLKGLRQCRINYSKILSLEITFLSHYFEGQEFGQSSAEQFCSSDAVCGHLLVFSWWLVWSGQSKMP